MSTWGLSTCGDIANIVIAVASVATAIVTAVVLFKQRNDNIKEKQPRFTFTPQDGSLIIRGEQSKCLQIEGVDVNKCVEVWRLDKKLRKVIPLKHSPVVRITQDDTGIYASFGLDTMQNVILFKKFNSDEMEIDSSLWNYRVVDLLCIKYIDIHLCHREQYFVNRTIASKKEYKKYFRLANKVSKVPLAVSDIDLKKVLGFK
uniref:hypothetical protein n=1 Tax=Alistipes sp. TaxID=1872444 RepID=UPI0040563F89